MPTDTPLPSPQACGWECPLISKCPSHVNNPRKGSANRDFPPTSGASSIRPRLRVLALSVCATRKSQTRDQVPASSEKLSQFISSPRGQNTEAFPGAPETSDVRVSQVLMWSQRAQVKRDTGPTPCSPVCKSTHHLINLPPWAGLDQVPPELLRTDTLASGQEGEQP